MPDPTPDEAAALLRVAEQQLDQWKAECRALEARLDAQQPVLDAALEAADQHHRDKCQGVNFSTTDPLGPLSDAVDAYRAASGSVEADTPAERADCGQDDHEWVRCATCPTTGPCACAGAVCCGRERAETSREVAGTPAAEPAPDREQAPHFMHTQDVIEDALVGAGYQDLPGLADIVFVATEAARDALGVCQVCGSGQPGMYPSDPSADGYAGPEECSACDGTGWARAGAGAPTEPADGRAPDLKITLTMDDPTAPDWGGEMGEDGNPIYHHAWDTTDGELRLWVGPYTGELNSGWAVTLNGPGLDVALRAEPDQVLEWADNVKAAIEDSRAVAAEPADDTQETNHG